MSKQPPRKQKSAAPAPATEGAPSRVLTERTRLFVEAYTGTCQGNGTQAAIAAGYSPRSAHAQGCRLLKDADVRAAIAAVQGPLLKQHAITRERILQELAHGAFFNLREALDERGNLLPPKDWPEHVARAVSSLEYDQLGNPKLRPVDKLTALKLLGQTLALFVEKHEHTADETLGALVLASLGKPAEAKP